ncbi:hypothetical protein IQ06DRAFT_42637 [Phaeosphaeriaceae sp. SRC1lsM3a]|nr:hypothetical protein IQ06DRAFT_42637 [Stagonospora sp. SRC1lsM3a]
MATCSRRTCAVAAPAVARRVACRLVEYRATHEHTTVNMCPMLQHRAAGRRSRFPDCQPQNPSPSTTQERDQRSEHNLQPGRGAIYFTFRRSFRSCKPCPWTSILSRDTTSSVHLVSHLHHYVAMQAKPPHEHYIQHARLSKHPAKMLSSPLRMKRP